MKGTNILLKELLNGFLWGGMGWLIFEALLAIGLRENAAIVFTICMMLGGGISLLEQD